MPSYVQTAGTVAQPILGHLSYCDTFGVNDAFPHAFPSIIATDLLTSIEGRGLNTPLYIGRWLLFECSMFAEPS